MDQHELSKLLFDIKEQYKEDIGERFAKSIGFQIDGLSWEEQKRELLTIIAQLVDMDNA